MLNISRVFFQNKTLKNISLIAGGTAIGQILLLISTPILTRLYTIEDFGIFQIFLSIFNFLYVVSAGKFENAILLTKSIVDTSTLILLGLLSAVILGFGFLILNIIYDTLDYNIHLIDQIYEFIYLYPVAIILSSVYLVLSSLAIKNKSFKVLGITKISQAIFQVAIQLFFGFVIYRKAWGLVVGDIVGKIGGSLYLFIKLKNRIIFHAISYSSIKYNFTQFRHFPSYAAPAALINALGISLPFLMIGGLYGSFALGYLMLVHRVFAAPSSLIGQSVSQVYMSSISEAISRDNPQKAMHIFQSYTFNLFKAGLIPFILFAIVSPYAFNIVFGVKWTEAGFYAQLLTFGYFAGFVISPVSHTLNMLSLSRWQLGWDIFRTSVNFIGIYIIYHVGLDLTYCVSFYSLSLFLTYIVYYFMARRGIVKYSEANLMKY